MTSVPAVLAFLIAHAAVGVLMHQWSIVAFVHAVIVVMLGLRWAMRVDVDRVPPALAYITGSEVLWRMTTDRLPWELGKYAVIAICAVAIVRRQGPKGLLAPLLCFSLLVPSAALTVSSLPLEEARQQISFNLSGPLALAICVGWFRLTHFSLVQLQRVFLSLLGPVVAMAAIAVFGIVTAPDIAFNTESNFATSGGFGPNQVSAMFGLGALVALLSLFTTAGTWPYRVVMFGTLCWLATQSALTFSRGGLYAAGGAAILALVCQVRDSSARLRLALIATLIFTLGRYVVWPRLDAFTGGTITARFTETDVTRRGDIGSEDMATWNAHPVFGVGPGRSSLEHDDRIIAHTEFTRLVAEHGSLGAAAIVLMLFVGLRAFRDARSHLGQTLALAMLTWATLFMLNSAMRTVAPAFMFGLAFAHVGGAIRMPASPVVFLRRRVLAAPRRRVLARI
jgi:hypothetical protein